ncbi:50S ribosomal protein L18 [Candidatus Woesearchaeota archaeon]|nr:50S ribosomal protein L18 [Candidatus Woesearchaeota archaeon]
MTHQIPKTVPQRRVREHKTNYRKRRSLLMSGIPRLVVRFTNQRVIGQITTTSAQGDKVLVATDSFALRKHGWKYSCKNIPATYLVGIALAKKALSKGQKKAILDVGFKSPLKKSKLYAFLKGVLDGGLGVPCGEGVFPEEKRISGTHIPPQLLKSVPQPEQLTATCMQVKKELMK